MVCESWSVDITSEEQRELFPVIERKASHVGILWRYLQATAIHGALVPVAFACDALKVSRQRVYQLIDAGQLVAIEINGRKWVPAAAVELLLTEDRKSGVRLWRRWIDSEDEK